MNYPTVPIEIISSPTDWVTVAAAMFAAFFGAATAFGFNAFFDRLRERKKRLDAINTAIYGLTLTMGSLVNIKWQFLTQFNAEFETVKAMLAQMSSAMSPAQTNATANAVWEIFGSISQQDSSLNGAFISWQEEEFSMMPNPNDFHFSMDANPELVRVMHVANDQVVQISKRIKERNSFWRDHTPAGLNDDDPIEKRLTFFFQMLSCRSVIAEHVDVALVLIKDVCDQLVSYRSNKLRKRSRYTRWFFEIFTDSEIWTTYKPSKSLTDAIPDKRLYKRIFDVVEDE